MYEKEIEIAKDFYKEIKKKKLKLNEAQIVISYLSTLVSCEGELK